MAGRGDVACIVNFVKLAINWRFPRPNTYNFSLSPAPRAIPSIAEKCKAKGMLIEHNFLLAV